MHSTKASTKPLSKNKIFKGIPRMLLSRIPVFPLFGDFISVFEKIWSFFVRFAPQISFANLGSKVHKSTCQDVAPQICICLSQLCRHQTLEEFARDLVHVTCSSREPPNIWASRASTYLRSTIFSPLLSRLQPRKEKLLPLWESEQRLGRTQKRFHEMHEMHWNAWVPSNKSKMNLKSNLSLCLGFRRLRTSEAPASHFSYENTWLTQRNQGIGWCLQGWTFTVPAKPWYSEMAKLLGMFSHDVTMMLLVSAYPKSKYIWKRVGPGRIKKTHLNSTKLNKSRLPKQRCELEHLKYS